LAASKERANAILSSRNPKDIWVLSDMPDQVNGKSLAKTLLFNKHWYGDLKLSNEEQMRRFNEYVER
jgi:hypothetical protein